MSHARRTIRDRVVQILEAADVAQTVSASRVHPLPADVLAAALVYANSESVTGTTLTYPRTYHRELQLVVEVVTRDTRHMDDRLDNLCANVENAIGEDHTLGGLVKDCQLTDTALTMSFDGDAPIGAARMVFRTLYMTSETDAGSVVE